MGPNVSQSLNLKNISSITPVHFNFKVSSWLAEMSLEDDAYASSKPPPPYAESLDSWSTSGECQSKVPRNPCRLIAVMGSTGSGKSTLISKLSDRSVNIGHNLKSCM